MFYVLLSHTTPVLGSAMLVCGIEWSAYVGYPFADSASVIALSGAVHFDCARMHIFITEEYLVSICNMFDLLFLLRYHLVRSELVNNFTLSALGTFFLQKALLLA
jgi:hypothetical protein